MGWPKNRRERKARERMVRAGEVKQGKVLSLIPPEGAPLNLAVATIAARCGAQLIDFIITTLATIVLFLVISVLSRPGMAGESAIGGLIVLLLGAPFYMLCELFMNGRTPGKRLVGIRVVSRDGAGLSTHQVVMRNLTKEVEVFLPISFLLTFQTMPSWLVILMFTWLAAVFAVPIVNRANQRLGDLAAGTAVIVDPRPVLLEDVATKADQATLERFVFTSAQLDVYGAYELQVLEKLLRPQARATAAPSPGKERLNGLTAVGQRIRAKIGYDESVEPKDEEAFLRSFYVAQRGYLEKKKLFGEARANKFHHGEPTASAVLAPAPGPIRSTASPAASNGAEGPGRTNEPTNQVQHSSTKGLT
ncbi:RDD family protein [Afifella aestuarii]|uniref:RDD family protein n=1 Tax=Afifella aestuarii TaxID=1909496 RepID=UPI0013E400FB|nr:RDD family protein [Afifella aestuarii]